MIWQAGCDFASLSLCSAGALVVTSASGHCECFACLAGEMVELQARVGDVEIMARDDW